MWVARNSDGCLLMFSTKPYKYEDYNGKTVWDITSEESENGEFRCHLFDIDLFPNLTYEDEPEEIELKMKDYLYKITCPNCNKKIKFHQSDIKYEYDEQPCSSGGYCDEDEYILCPECGKYINFNLHHT